MTLWLRRTGTGQMARGSVDLDASPCPVIMAGGLGGGNCSQYYLEDDGKGSGPMTTDKPAYRVPSMAEIAAIPWNGFTVASLFAGCGGSCLGYRMAGFKVAYANEFVEAAQATYRANNPDTFLDPRDVRAVTAADILAATGLAEIDLLDGSPPCASFSSAGKRDETWGEARPYSDGKVQRVDDLFFEYARLVAELRPKVFVAENVSGLVKGVSKGYFIDILRALRACGYQVEAKLLDAQWLGVPQSRQRIFFVGVRDDIGLAPAFPKPLPYFYSVRDAIDDLAPVGDAFLVEKANGLESIGEGGHRFADVADKPFPTVQANRPVRVKDGDGDAEIAIGRFAIGREWEKLAPGQQSDRYFNLVRPHPDRPCPTVTQRGGTVNAASVTHPAEKRKFTIAELRRICGFPDDYVLTGTYPQQWERLGRAVPPVMMAHLAKAIRDAVLDAPKPAIR